MNLLIIKPNEFTNSLKNTAILLAERAKYVYEFFHLKVGDIIPCGELNGFLGKATVLYFSANKIELEVSLNNQTESAKLKNLSLLLCIPRPQILKKVLSVVSEVGITKIYLYASDKSQKSYLTSNVLQTESLEYFLIKGLEQSATTLIPEISIIQDFSALRNELLTENFSNFTNKYLAHISNDPNVSSEELSVEICNNNWAVGKNIIYAIGAERGWSEREVEVLSSADFSLISLGDRILRVDTAVAYSAGRILG